MAASPVPILVIIGIYATFYMVWSGSQTANTYGADQPGTYAEPGGLDALFGVFHVIWSFITLLVGALIFNVPGVPLFVQIPIAVTINGSLTWSIVTLARGT